MNHSWRGGSSGQGNGIHAVVSAFEAMKGSPVTKETIIRKAGMRDLGRLLEIERECFVDHRFDENQFEYYLRNPSAICAVAEREGGSVGYIIGIIYHGRRGNISRLYSIAVSSRFRNHGVGAALLEFFETVALKGECLSGTLEVHEGNMPAVALFQSFKYVRRRRLRDFYGPGEHAYRMGKHYRKGED